MCTSGQVAENLLLTGLGLAVFLMHCYLYRKHWSTRGAHTHMRVYSLVGAGFYVLLGLDYNTCFFSTPSVIAPAMTTGMIFGVAMFCVEVCWSCFTVGYSALTLGRAPRRVRRMMQVVTITVIVYIFVSLWVEEIVYRVGAADDTIREMHLVQGWLYFTLALTWFLTFCTISTVFLHKMYGAVKHLHVQSTNPTAVRIQEIRRRIFRRMLAVCFLTLLVIAAATFQLLGVLDDLSDTIWIDAPGEVVGAFTTTAFYGILALWLFLAWSCSVSYPEQSVVPTRSQVTRISNGSFETVTPSTLPLSKTATTRHTTPRVAHPVYTPKNTIDAGAE